MSKDDLLVSIRRTVVPIIVGVLAGSFLSPHVDLGALEHVVSGVVSAVYYVVLRLGEARIPQLGRLLGAMKQPTYVTSET
jgi:uncharacterized membrane protein YeaQ/YmgE (transglycosylase-associated protein family)